MLTELCRWTWTKTASRRVSARHREQIIEVLEVRMLPSCLDPGTFRDISPDPDENPVTLTVNPENEDGDQIVFLNHPNFGNVRMKVRCKKNETAVIKVDSKGSKIKGKIIAEKVGADGIDIFMRMHGNGTADLSHYTLGRL